MNNNLWLLWLNDVDIIVINHIQYAFSVLIWIFEWIRWCVCHSSTNLKLVKNQLLSSLIEWAAAKASAFSQLLLTGFVVAKGFVLHAIKMSRLFCKIEIRFFFVNWGQIKIQESKEMEYYAKMSNSNFVDSSVDNGVPVSP